MRKWILFGALILGLVEMEWGLERWADHITRDSKGGSARIMESPFPPPTPEPTVQF